MLGLAGSGFNDRIGSDDGWVMEWNRNGIGGVLGCLFFLFPFLFPTSIGIGAVRSGADRLQAKVGVGVACDC